MLLVSIILLINCVWYSWITFGALGYHGVFFSIIFFLWLIVYWSYWELYNLWIWDMTYTIDLYNWIELGNHIIINVTMTGDLISILLLCIMTAGSGIVVMFVYIEMWDDKEGIIFILLLMLFLIFMSILVGSSNLIVFYIGWEGIGLTSLFLINFWSERIRSNRAVVKVFFINKIGDLLLFLGIVILLSNFGCIDFRFIEASIFIWNNKYLTCCGYSLLLLDVVIMFFVLSSGVKSVQFGFHIWLLEAMEAPLGASALMHSSTLVVAGIILLIKIYIILDYSWFARSFMIIWGSWTAFFGAFIACWQYELKVILAYSTISSMGFIYLLLGLGSLREAITYLILHAFAKIFFF